MRNDGDDERSCRVLSAIVDGEGKVVGTVRSAFAPVKPWDRLEFEQQITLREPGAVVAGYAESVPPADYRRERRRRGGSL